jgi:hypothetical protein
MADELADVQSVLSRRQDVVGLRDLSPVQWKSGIAAWRCCAQASSFFPPPASPGCCRKPATVI